MLQKWARYPAILIDASALPVALEGVQTVGIATEWAVHLPAFVSAPPVIATMDDFVQSFAAWAGVKYGG